MLRVHIYFRKENEHYWLVCEDINLTDGQFLRFFNDKKEILKFDVSDISFMYIGEKGGSVDGSKNEKA